jgi:hypothetical protein
LTVDFVNPDKKNFLSAKKNAVELGLTCRFSCGRFGPA